MYRIYCNRKTHVVEQIFDLSSNPDLVDTLQEGMFGDHYIVDTEEVVGFNQKYNTKSDTFEINPDYVEPDTTVIPNGIDMIKDELKKKDDEIRKLKLSITEMSKEIAELRVAMGKLVPGGI